MTHRRVNGIKTGYWSPAGKEDLVQRLAAYEDTGLEPEEVVMIENEYRNICDERKESKQCFSNNRF